MSIVKYSAELTLKPLLAFAVGATMSYRSDDITPLQGATFCLLSQVVSEIAWPVINNSFNKNSSGIVKKCTGVAAYVICCSEAPRALMEYSGSSLSSVSANSLFLTSIFLTGMIYKIGNGFISVRNSRHPALYDAFLDGEFPSGTRS